MGAGKKYKSQITALKSCIKKLENELKTEPINLKNIERSISRIESQFKTTEEAWKHRVDLEEEDTIIEQVTSEFMDLDFNCHDVLERARVILPAPPEDSQVQSTGCNSVYEARLPVIHIEPFDGDFTKWKQFDDVFTGLVHKKKNITGAEKLQLLKNSLRGKAAKVIASFSVTNANYEEAWNMLQSRFNNKRLIVDNLFSQLIETKPINSSSGLSDLVNMVDGINRSLQKLDIEDKFDAFLSHLLSTRLDRVTARAWEDTQTKEVPQYSKMLQFLEGRLDHKEIPDYSTSTTTQAAVRNQSAPCPACKQQHKPWTCDSFHRATVQERWNLVKAARLCVNCLQGTHMASVCRTSGCRKCAEKHHTMLHSEKRAFNSKENSSNSEVKPSTSKTVATSLMMGDSTQPSLLGTANVYILDGNGQPVKIRALLDQGAQANILTRQCMAKLKLPEQTATTSLQCIGYATPQGTQTQCKITVQNSKGDFMYQGNAVVMDYIMGNQPQQPIVKPLKLIKGLDLADENFDQPGPIEALLGVDLYMKACRRGLKHPKGNGPGAQNTAFGWVLMGSITSSMLQQNLHSYPTQVNALTMEASKLWALKEVPKGPIRTAEDKACEYSYRQNTKRHADGHYVVRLPLSQVPPDLGESRAQAIRRQLNLEQRFKRNEEFAKEYKKVMQDYLDRGHMRKATVRSAELIPYYIPHHAVIKLSSQTTKLRVVFDSSAKTSNGKSLNDNMYTGPRLQDDLKDILTRFRTHRFVFTADIEKMYRMIELHEEDRTLHRIIWRENEKRPFGEYELTTVTFGDKAAPFLAVRTLHQLAHDENHKFPDAARVLTMDFYVDDLLSGAETLQEAALLVQQISKLLQAGGFRLTKWASNAQGVLQHTAAEDKSIAPVTVMDESGIKTLGTQWLPDSDKFRFCYEEPRHPKITKRTMLSDLGKLFDPLGWLLPTTIRGRIMFQNLWRENIDWDTPVPPVFADQWMKYLADLQNVNKILISRCIKGHEDGKYALYGFCDSSELAYGVCVYLQTQGSAGTQSHLIAAKARVATLHATTLPRLELCGALELAHLLESVEAALHLPISEVHAYTDSTITLQWIKNLNFRWKPFVANRVSEIHNAVPHARWHHIAGKNNIADCISRGISATELATLQDWWTGPPIVYQTMQQDEEIPSPGEEAKQEARTTTICTIITNTYEENIISRFSNYNRLLRVTAWMKRFADRARKRNENNSPFITPAELEASRNLWIAKAQHDVFPTIFKGGSIPTNIQTLNPFLDGSGIMRVGGRLKNADLSTDQRQPILLPKQARITRLIIEQCHRDTLHGGIQVMMTTLRQQYWIPHMKNLVKQVYRQCGKCTRLRAKTCTQLMGDLPKSRVTAARPFQRTGVDYMGPFWIKTRNGRGAKKCKGYVAIFICFTTRAIHLEYVGDLTTAAFLGALRRFIARRGKPSNIFSDSGTNLVGGNNELKQFLEIASNEYRQTLIGEQLAQMGITWHFSPPAAPHFGGLWEAGVKSTKYHLKRIMGDTALTTEELETVLCQVEAVLNSRPLVDISDDPSDLLALTPGHFLIGGPLIAHPEPDFTKYKESHLTRWTRLQQMVQHFWRRWHGEYLTRLQQRPKWAKATKDLEVNELVLLKEENVPPLHWNLARITEIHPGADGHVRVVTLKTAKGTYKRPVTKVCRLPINRDEEEES